MPRCMPVNRRRREAPPTYTCERCGAPAGTHGVTCDPCHRGVIESLLSSPGWCAVAATRPGFRAGETLLDSYQREGNR